ncbi:MAG TPA: four-carbon acid sugar kinase family protein [Opitutus sp.]|nr:four-carbon acid sugar kinase family protein [Opitutus sp.]
MPQINKRLMPDFLLADDLSGALDAAGAFYAAGRQVLVCLWRREMSASRHCDGSSPGGMVQIEDLPEQPDLIVLTTESRNDLRDIATEKVRRAVRFVRASGGRLLFKKIDSTMRGPVAAELEALAKAMPGTRILFTPANPAVGRIVREGILYIHGVPVAETEFARDPVSPVRESSIRRLLGDAAGGQVVIADAETQADLEKAVSRMAKIDENWIAVGSGALARAVAAHMAQGDLSLAANDPEPAFNSMKRQKIEAGPVLVVCGSAHSVNRGQAVRFAHERKAQVHELRHEGAAGAVAEAAASLRAGRDAVLMAEAERGERNAVLANVTDAAAKLVELCGVRRVFVTGGETAFALCARLGIPALEFVEEIEPGVSLSVGRMSGGPILLGIKPGGFGDEMTWMRVRERMRQVS